VTFACVAHLSLPDEGRTFDVTGNVRLGGRWPVVTQLRVVDQRTGEEMDDPPAWVEELAEEALVTAARECWARAS
jgi:hypothetical protein